MRLNVYFCSKNAWLLANAFFVFLHFLRFLRFCVFWVYFYVFLKKYMIFFSLEFLVKNDLSYLSGIQMIIQFKLSASALFLSLLYSYITSSPVSFTVHYVGRRIIKEDGVTSRNNQSQLITQMAYHDRKKIL